MNILYDIINFLPFYVRFGILFSGDQFSFNLKDLCFRQGIIVAETA